MSDKERINLNDYAVKYMAQFQESLPHAKTKLILGGNTGAGKSVLSLTFPKIHYICFDDSFTAGLRHCNRFGFTPDLVAVDCAADHVDEDGKVDRPLIYEILKNRVKKAMDNPDSETVVIDSVSSIYDMIEVVAANKTAGDKNSYAKWNEVIKQMLEIFSWQALSNKNIIILVHWEKEKGPDGLERWYPKLPTNLQFDFGKEYQNMWNLYVNYSDTHSSGTGQRMLQTMPSSAFDILKTSEPQRDVLRIPEDPNLIYQALKDAKLV